MSSVFPLEAQGVTCFFEGNSVLDCAEASTIEIKLHNYYYSNYAIEVYFSYVILISNLITVSKDPCL